MSEQFNIIGGVSIAVLTVSDTRTTETDHSGELIRKLVSDQKDMDVVDYQIVKDEVVDIRGTLKKWLEEESIDAIIITGGTGIAKRDNSIESIEPFYEKKIQGFGELFRHLSFTEDIGTRAMLTRASAGTASDKAIFILPGSRGAVRLGMERLILPELHHIIYELKKHVHPRS